MDRKRRNQPGKAVTDQRAGPMRRGPRIDSPEPAEPVAGGGAVGAPLAFPPQRVPWNMRQVLALLGAYLAIVLSFNLVGRFAFEMLNQTDTATAISARIGIQIGCSQAAFLLLLYWFVKGRAGGGIEAGRMLGLYVPRPWKALESAIVPAVVGAGVVCLIIVVNSLLARHLQLRQQLVVSDMEVAIRRGGAYEIAMCAVFAVLVAPFVEEPLFRGLLYLPLRSRLGPVGAGLLVSLVFALVHSAWSALLPMFVLALAFTWLLEATRTLWAPIAAHMLFNGVMIVLIVKGAAAAH